MIVKYYHEAITSELHTEIRHALSLPPSQYLSRQLLRHLVSVSAVPSPLRHSHPNNSGQPPGHGVPHYRRSGGVFCIKNGLFFEIDFTHNNAALPHKPFSLEKVCCVRGFVGVDKGEVKMRLGLELPQGINGWAGDDLYQRR